MAVELDFSSAEEMRERLTKTQQKQIERLYKQAAKDIAKQASQAPRVPSDSLKIWYLNNLKDQLNERMNQMRSEIEGITKQNMEQVAGAVVQDSKDFLSSVGMPISGVYSHVPDDIVKAVATGQLYEGNWTLSRAIWKDTVKTQSDINTIVATGIAENKSAYDIAKDLEKYVDPSAAKDWDWSKVYPGTKRKVDYNAQRLARTMVSHAYQQSFVRTTQKNPFVVSYKWESSNSDRTCEICAERDGQLYPKDDLPLDHPNGMCTFIAVIEDSMEEIADRLGDWAYGGTDPELDTWAQDLYGKNWQEQKQEVAQKASVSDQVNQMTKIGDINKTINKSGWFTNKIYLQGCDIETAQHITEAYQNIFDRYPSLQGKFPAPVVGMTSNPKAYANCATSGNGQITLNKSKFSNWETLVSNYNRDVMLGFHPEGTTAQSLIYHEFGHAIDGWLSRESLVRNGTEYASSSMIEKALDKSGMSSSTIGWKVSSYAKKNDRECFAECFAQGMQSKEPCSLTVELMKDLDNLIGG